MISEGSFDHFLCLVTDQLWSKFSYLGVEREAIEEYLFIYSHKEHLEFMEIYNLGEVLRYLWKKSIKVKLILKGMKFYRAIKHEILRKRLQAWVLVVGSGSHKSLKLHKSQKHFWYNCSTMSVNSCVKEEKKKKEKEKVLSKRWITLRFFSVICICNV